MNKPCRLAFTLLLGLSLSAHLRADEPAKEVVVATVAGRVILDANRNGSIDEGEKGLPDILVTDGIQFVRTGPDGAYSIKAADDPLIPYKPSQVISISWPTSTWPMGRHWYMRLGDVKPGQSVDFLLRQDKQELPLTFVHGTDPHNNLAGSEPFRDDVDRMDDLVDFCIFTGDLGYAGRDSANAFGQMRAFTRQFPIPMLHVPGNHDVVGIHTTEWSKQDAIAGYGLYTEYLGPIRWSFNYAGIHFVGLDWARIAEEGKLQTGVPDIVIDWLKKDLGQLKPGTRTLVFMHHHFRHGDDKFWDVLVEHKVELVVAGHSHRNLDQSRRGVEAFTTMNLAGGYRLVTLHEKGHSYVHRCFGCKNGLDSHSKHCLLRREDYSMKRGAHQEVVAWELNSKEHSVAGLKAKKLEIVAELEPGTAKKYGLRIVADGSKEAPLEIVCNDDLLQVGESKTAAVRSRGEKEYRLHILVDNGAVKVFANRRARIDRPFAPDSPCRVVLFADGGTAVFKKVDVWEIK